jgi:hypothetical protein
MKTKLALLALGGSLLLGVPALLAQSSTTNGPSPEQMWKYQIALENDRSLGERALLPPGLKEKMHLTDEQKTELKPFEEDFAVTSGEFQVANQPRIEAALAVSRQARESKDPAQIQAARLQMQNVWAGLQPYRAAAVKQIKPLLMPDQILILDDAKNQWRENRGDEANDPSAR